MEKALSWERVGWSGETKRLKKKGYGLNVTPFPDKMTPFYRVSTMLHLHTADYFLLFAGGLVVWWDYFVCVCVCWGFFCCFVSFF